ncbi:hypothetical protein HII31_03851 [Pseudocercospora fuligena]|uniref:Uncharacterized protein n=1 Tax=Pseudocercospora fuligena TaxID=685502 RepID=A0A8H6VKB2_9PEZI|nr:hypothetical protein HII31_03851 [Pseudocercospora fuligena]
MTLAKSAMLLIVAEGISQLKWVYFREQSRRLYDMLHFDNASRGPWGAAELMWSVRWHAVIASIGAFITIVALAMDPFTQQVIAYETTDRNVTGVAATFRNARSYDDRLPNSSSGNDIRGDLKMQLNVTAAIFSGISQATQKVAFTCGTGNCTWPIIHTLGVCSSCQNLTGTTKPKCSTPTYTETCNITYNGIFVQASNKESQPGPQWTTSELTLLNISSEYPLSGNDSFNGSLDHILAVLPNADTANVHFPSSINTYSCNLSLCQKSYNSTVVNGTLIETLISTSPLTFPLCGLSGSLSSTGNTWLDPTTQVETCPGFLDSNIPQSLDPTNRIAMLTDPSIFWINAATVQEMRIFIRDLMSNQSTSTTTAGTGAYSVDKSLANMLYYSNSGDYVETMNGIAEALSNNVIRHGPNATWQSGTAQVPTTRLKVIWGWLTLPVGSVVSSVVFLGVVILFSSAGDKRGVVWKSSILATMFHRLEGQDLDKRTLEEMESTAKEVRVRLGEDGEGNLGLLREGGQIAALNGAKDSGIRRRWFRS